MGWLTALTAIPFHVLFYFYNGLSFLTGIAAYSIRWVREGRYKPGRRGIVEQQKPIAER
jgi:hypothetical protein